MKLTTHITYNKIIKRFSQVGPGGKKLGEKMAETMSKTSAAAPTIAPKNPNKGLPKYSPTNKNQDNTDVAKNAWKPETTPTIQPIIPSHEKNPSSAAIPSISDAVKKDNYSSQPTTFIDNTIANHLYNTMKKPSLSDNNEAASSIPIPPAASPLPNKIIDFSSITEENLKIAKQNLSGSFSIPPNTKITGDIKSHDINTQDLILEGFMRGLLKKNDNNKIITFKAVDDKDVTISSQKYDIKLTPLGHAHLREVDDTKYSPHNVKEFNTDEYDYDLAIAKFGDNDDSVLLSPKQTHVVTIVIKKKDVDEYYIIGYLTSKKVSDQPIINYQFKDFQSHKETNDDTVIVNKKPQYITFLDNLEKIDKKNLTFLKWGQDYIQIKKLKDSLIEKQDEVIKENAQDFNLVGISKNNLIDIMKNFDNKIHNKLPQPKTSDQVLHKQKQDKQNEEKKLNKEKDNNDNINNPYE